MAIRFTPSSTEVQAYLNSIRKYEVLSPEEEAELFRRYKEEGDISARDMIMNCNQRIVFSEAKKRAARNAELMDYVDEGNIGLSKAIEAYDPSRGFRFMTIAMWYVKREMSRYKVNSAEMRQSNAGKYTSAIMKIKNRYFSEEGREPSVAELKAGLKDLGIEVKDDRDLLDLRIKSADDEVAEDVSYGSTPEYIEATACRNGWEDIEKTEADSSMASDALAALDPRSREIMRMSFGIGFGREYTDGEIADRFGLTNMRISQLKREALKKMKAALAC